MRSQVLVAALILPATISFAGPSSNSGRFAPLAAKLASGKFGKSRKAPNPKHAVDPSHEMLPNWSGSFRYQNQKYNFQMVGSDPAQGGSTTIDTVIIPYSLVFSDGTTFDATTDLIDGQTAVNGAINSPVFQNANWTVGGVNVGTTQFGDAIQRANFWNYSKNISTYHVLLGHPHVLPRQVIQVPAADGIAVTVGDSVVGFTTVGLVDFQWLDTTLINTMASLNIAPTSLAINLFTQVIADSLNDGGALGYHTAFDYSGNKFKTQGAVTYMFASWFSNSAFGSEPGIGNTGTLGHEVAEWLNDPFVGNVVPYWQDPATPGLCEQDFLEVADPLEELNYFPVTTNGFQYTLPDVAFLPWFERLSQSFSAGGWYSLFNEVPTFSGACPGFTDYTLASYDAPGAIATFFHGINKQGQIAGYYVDASSNQHGFTFNGNHFSPVTIPGAVSVRVNRINDSGALVGSYIDAGGNQHGFLMQGPRVSTIDYPGALATAAYGLNNSKSPDVVGEYVDGGGVIHGFELTGNNFYTITVPFGSPVNVHVLSINDSGAVAGFFDDGVTLVGFAGPPNSLVPVIEPHQVASAAFSLTDSAQIVGESYVEPGFYHGLIDLGGLYSQFDYFQDADGELQTIIFDTNASGVLVGTYLDANLVYHAYIATPFK